MRNEGMNFTKEEEAGYNLFKQHCSSCHAEPLFTNQLFANNAIGAGMHKDEGRYSVTQKLEDKFFFKVPSLRNISVTAPYMHDGRFTTLEEVLQHYGRSFELGTLLNPTPQINQKKKNMLTSHNNSEIISFLSTLTDSAFLTNPSLK